MAMSKGLYSLFLFFELVLDEELFCFLRLQWDWQLAPVEVRAGSALRGPALRSLQTRLMALSGLQLFSQITVL